MKKIESLILNRKVKAEIPIIPNFIKCNNEMVSIKDFSGEELKSIANAWKENLIEKSLS